MEEKRKPGRPKGSLKKLGQRGIPKRLKPKTRRATPFIRKSIEEINLEIREAYKQVTGEDQFWDTYTKINAADAEHCYYAHRGRCTYCDNRLSYLGRMSRYSARLAFYVPLKVGGEARVDNLILVCAQCKAGYRTTRKLREDIFGIDSFADLCEALFLAVKDEAHVDRINQIKNRLNIRLSDVATCMRYTIKADWVPTKMEKIVEEDNTIGERLEQLARGEDVKEKITEDMKQIIMTKQYKIMRKPAEGNTERKT